MCDSTELSCWIFFYNCLSFTMDHDLFFWSRSQFNTMAVNGDNGQIMGHFGSLTLIMKSYMKSLTFTMIQHQFMIDLRLICDWFAINSQMRISKAILLCVVCCHKGFAMICHDSRLICHRFLNMDTSKVILLCLILRPAGLGMIFHHSWLIRDWFVINS